MKHVKTEQNTVLRHAQKRDSRGSGALPVYLPRRVWVGVCAVFVSLTVLITAYAMKQPAITITSADCGIEEHTHTADCYEQELICDNTDAQHEHTDACYAQQAILTCDIEQHTHTDECHSAEETVADAVDVIAESGLDLSAYTDLETFLQTVNGSAESELYDKTGNLVDNLYEASGDGYSYQFTLTADCILPGVYYYKLPNNLISNDMHEGSITDHGEKIGEFYILPDEPYLFFSFTEDINSVQDTSGELSFGCSFAARMKPSVSKSGYVISSDNVMDGYFHFAIQAKIPAAGIGIPMREWRLTDRSRTTVITEQTVDNKEWDHDFGSAINAPNTKVYLSCGDVIRYELHDLRDIWQDENVSVAYYADSESKSLYLVNRCACDDERCVRCGECSCELMNDYDGWCTCWNLEEDATLDIEYINAVNDDGKLIMGNQKELSEAQSANYHNTVTLKGDYYKNGEVFTESKLATANVDFSATINKEETVKASKANGMKSTFHVVINPQKADLSKIDLDNDGCYDDIVVFDRMTGQKYVTGSMTITAETAEDEQFLLDPGTDYTVEAVQTEAGSELTVTIKMTGPWMYVIEYKGQTFAAEDGMVRISNGVSINLFSHNEGGDSGEQDNPEYMYTRNFSYKDKWIFGKYKVTVSKIDAADPTDMLRDAVFGLYARNGTEIARGTTGEDGQVEFVTNVAAGIIFENGIPYYIKEISPPEGYDVNTVPYWFYFAEAQNTSLEEELTALYPGAGIVHIAPDNTTSYTAQIAIADERLYTLPETGGAGTRTYIITGLMLLFAAAFVIVIKKRNTG
jgi:LPXTG-motif cell wall-anchored protein